MNEIDNIESIYLYEKNLLKSCTNILLETSTEELHDYILSIFDEVDEVTRKIYKYLEKSNKISKDRISNKKKESLYEELDTYLIEMNNI